ncbi:MAG: ABC transporter ATP-binding protein [Eubacteriales bacterium]|nr:ABC transporter ATP-binding protein [Eubacteriales bacterium]
MAENKHYLSSRELRKIAKENRRQTKLYEKKKRQKVSPETYTTQMKDPNNILEIEDLHTFFFTDAGTVKSVNGVTFSIPRGKIVGVVGESGCGKSVTSLSVMQLVQAPQGQIVSGSIRFSTSDIVYDASGKALPVYETETGADGKETVVTKQVTSKNGKTKEVPVQKVGEDGLPVFKTEEKVFDIAKMPIADMRKIRGREISMIFQEPMTSLNPVFTVGYQLDEVILINNPGATREDARRRSIQMLNEVGIAMPEAVYKKYPHELSGGMRQRIMIAMAVACNPKLIIADEPTTALDVTIQAQILDLLKKLKNRINGSIMLITHDLGVIAGMADYVVIMYAGRIIEQGTVFDIFDHPCHPYTIGLQKSKPVVNRDTEWLYSIPGRVPNPIDLPNTCYFKDRCQYCSKSCNRPYPELVKLSDTHYVACYRAAEIEEARSRNHGKAK